MTDATDTTGRPAPTAAPDGPAGDEAPCGTYAAAQRHARRGEPLDDACRDAYREYHRENPGKQERNRARQRAFAKLAKRHPEEFRRLYTDELMAEMLRAAGVDAA